jgi:uncharacterized C2H2 Zn-finger protein
VAVPVKPERQFKHHTGTKHECPQCDADYTTKKARNDHLRRAHGVRFEFKCRQRGCPEDYETERGRQRHETEMHPGLTVPAAKVA